MQTTNKSGELAIAVCPECDFHSVCDPAWLGLTGGTLSLPCDNCFGGKVETNHLILKFVEKKENE